MVSIENCFYASIGKAFMQSWYSFKKHRETFNNKNLHFGVISIVAKHFNYLCIATKP